MDEFRIMKKVDNRIFYLVAFLVGFILFYVVSSIFQMAFLVGFEARTPGFINDFQVLIQDQNYAMFTSQMWAVLNLSQFFGSLTMGIILFVFLGKSVWRDLKRFKDDLWHNIWGILVGFVFVLVGQIVLSKIYVYFGIDGTSDNQAGILMALEADSKVFMYLSVVLLAPVVEELLFRKLLYGVVEETFRMPRIVSILASAVIFSLLHAMDIFFFQYFLMALILCGSYSLFKNNIVVPIGIHFLNNAIILFNLFVAIF